MKRNTKYLVQTFLNGHLYHEQEITYRAFASLMQFWHGIRDTDTSIRSQHWFDGKSFSWIVMPLETAYGA